MGILFVSYPSFLLLTWFFVGVEYLFALWFWVDKDLGYFPPVLSGKPQGFTHCLVFLVMIDCLKLVGKISSLLFNIVFLSSV